MCVRPHLHLASSFSAVSQQTNLVSAASLHDVILSAACISPYMDMHVIHKRWYTCYKHTAPWITVNILYSGDTIFFAPFKYLYKLTRLIFWRYLSFHEAFSSSVILVLMNSCIVQLLKCLHYCNLGGLKSLYFRRWQVCHTKAAIRYGGVHLLIICELRKCTCSSNDWKFSISVVVAEAIPTYFQVGYLSILKVQYITWLHPSLGSSP